MLIENMMKKNILIVNIDDGSYWIIGFLMKDQWLVIIVNNQNNNCHN
jgi:hypothetical protein